MYFKVGKEIKDIFEDYEFNAAEIEKGFIPSYPVFEETILDRLFGKAEEGKKKSKISKEQALSDITAMWTDLKHRLSTQDHADYLRNQLAELKGKRAILEEVASNYAELFKLLNSDYPAFRKKVMGGKISEIEVEVFTRKIEASLYYDKVSALKPMSVKIKVAPAQDIIGIVSKLPMMDDYHLNKLRKMVKDARDKFEQGKKFLDVQIKKVESSIDHLGFIHEHKDVTVTQPAYLKGNPLVDSDALWGQLFGQDPESYYKSKKKEEDKPELSKIVTQPEKYVHERKRTLGYDWLRDRSFLDDLIKTVSLKLEPEELETTEKKAAENTSESEPYIGEIKYNSDRSSVSEKINDVKGRLKRVLQKLMLTIPSIYKSITEESHMLELIDQQAMGEYATLRTSLMSKYGPKKFQMLVSYDLTKSDFSDNDTVVKEALGNDAMADRERIRAFIRKFEEIKKENNNKFHSNWRTMGFDEHMKSLNDVANLYRALSHEQVFHDTQMSYLKQQGTQKYAKVKDPRDYYATAMKHLTELKEMLEKHPLFEALTHDKTTPERAKLEEAYKIDPEKITDEEYQAILEKERLKEKEEKDEGIFRSLDDPEEALKQKKEDEKEALKARQKNWNIIVEKMRDLLYREGQSIFNLQKKVSAVATAINKYKQNVDGYIDKVIIGDGIDPQAPKNDSRRVACDFLRKMARYLKTIYALANPDDPNDPDYVDPDYVDPDALSEGYWGDDTQKKPSPKPKIKPGEPIEYRPPDSPQTLSMPSTNRPGMAPRWEQNFYVQSFPQEKIVNELFSESGNIRINPDDFPKVIDRYWEPVEKELKKSHSPEAAKTEMVTLDKDYDKLSSDRAEISGRMNKLFDWAEDAGEKLESKLIETTAMTETAKKSIRQDMSRGKALIEKSKELLKQKKYEESQLDHYIAQIGGWAEDFKTKFITNVEGTPEVKQGIGTITEISQLIDGLKSELSAAFTEEGVDKEAYQKVMDKAVTLLDKWDALEEREKKGKTQKNILDKIVEDIETFSQAKKIKTEQVKDYRVKLDALKEGIKESVKTVGEGEQSIQDLLDDINEVQHRMSDIGVKLLNQSEALYKKMMANRRKYQELESASKSGISPENLDRYKRHFIAYVWGSIDEAWTRNIRRFQSSFNVSEFIDYLDRAEGLYAKVKQMVGGRVYSRILGRMLNEARAQLREYRKMPAKYQVSEADKNRLKTMIHSIKKFAADLTHYEKNLLDLIEEMEYFGKKTKKDDPDTMSDPKLLELAKKLREHYSGDHELTLEEYNSIHPMVTKNKDRMETQSAQKKDQVQKQWNIFESVWEDIPRSMSDYVFKSRQNPDKYEIRIQPAVVKAVVGVDIQPVQSEHVGRLEHLFSLYGINMPASRFSKDIVGSLFTLFNKMYYDYSVNPKDKKKIEEHLSYISKMLEGDKKEPYLNPPKKPKELRPGSWAYDPQRARSPSKKPHPEYEVALKTHGQMLDKILPKMKSLQEALKNPPTRAFDPTKWPAFRKMDQIFRGYEVGMPSHFVLDSSLVNTFTNLSKAMMGLYQKDSDKGSDIQEHLKYLKSQFEGDYPNIPLVKKSPELGIPEGKEPVKQILGILEDTIKSVKEPAKKKIQPTHVDKELGVTQYNLNNGYEVYLTTRGPRYFNSDGNEVILKKKGTENYPVEELAGMSKKEIDALVEKVVEKPDISKEKERRRGPDVGPRPMGAPEEKQRTWLTPVLPTSVRVAASFMGANVDSETLEAFLK